MIKYGLQMEKCAIVSNCEMGGLPKPTHCVGGSAVRKIQILEEPTDGGRWACLLNENRTESIAERSADELLVTDAVGFSRFFA